MRMEKGDRGAVKLFIGHSVAYPYFGENIAGFGGIFFHFAAKGGHEGAEGLGVGVIGGSPYLFQDIAACEDFSRIFISRDIRLNSMGVR